MDEFEPDQSEKQENIQDVEDYHIEEETSKAPADPESAAPEEHREVFQREDESLQETKQDLTPEKQEPEIYSEKEIHDALESIELKENIEDLEVSSKKIEDLDASSKNIEDLEGSSRRMENPKEPSKDIENLESNNIEKTQEEESSKTRQIAQEETPQNNTKTEAPSQDLHSIQSEIIQTLQSKLNSFERQLESQNLQIEILKQQVNQKDNQIENLTQQLAVFSNQVTPVQTSGSHYSLKAQIKQEDIDFWKTSEDSKPEDYETMKLEDLISKNDLWIASMERQTPLLFNRGSKKGGVKSNALTRQQLVPISHESKRLKRNPLGVRKPTQ